MEGNLPNIPGEMAGKVPSYEQYEKNPRKVTNYIAILILISYMSWNEFIRRSDCDKRVEVLEKAIVEYKEQKDEDRKRITSLERAFDIQRGIVDVVNEKADSITNKISAGGSY